MHKNNCKCAKYFKNQLILEKCDWWCIGHQNLSLSKSTTLNRLLGRIMDKNKSPFLHKNTLTRMALNYNLQTL
jgi:hypothetical protein